MSQQRNNATTIFQYMRDFNKPTGDLYKPKGYTQAWKEENRQGLVRTHLKRQKALPGYLVGENSKAITHLFFLGLSSECSVMPDDVVPLLRKK